MSNVFHTAVLSSVQPETHRLLTLGESAKPKMCLKGLISCPPCAYSLRRLGKRSGGMKAKASWPPINVLVPTLVFSRKKACSIWSDEPT